MSQSVRVAGRLAMSSVANFVRPPYHPIRQPTMKVVALVLATAATAAAFSTPSAPVARVAHVRWNLWDKFI